MPIITFTSDFGESDHYVAQVKAVILRNFPEAQIIDISHQIKSFDIGHMSHVLKSVFRSFPEGTVHLIGGEPLTAQKHPFIILKLEKHYFVAPNNGVLSLISEKPATKSFAISIKENAFLELPAIAAQMAKGTPPEDLGESKPDLKEYSSRKSKATRAEISGHVVHIDHYGNLITNIDKTDFDILSKEKNINLSFGRESIQEIHQAISDVEPSEIFAIFNAQGYLTIGMNEGNASQLLGLRHDSPVLLTFN